ncbi:asparaginase [Solihabitans fulvus]|uniref:Asparaginase n=1 Tax=Solihabitans fulvus TaxID=1892852 RepID=A0A5B2W657_9PSEU|nr:asparaginase [Solihabitans fulvus]KAA2247291.1 asparaginase [Solihabitans fulvus]
MSESNSVTVFTLGGTISANRADVGAPRLTGAQVVAGLAVSPDITVEVRDFRRVPSSSLTFEDLAELAEQVGKAVEAGSGVVVVQGTDTLEETAFLLDLTCRTPRPIVVTGAMRRPDLPGADGPGNLASAIAVAADPDCRDLGVLAVFADEIHAARHVHKAHTTSVATISSPGFGPLGVVVEGEPRVLFRPARPTVPRPLRLREAVRVGLVTLSLGDRGELLDCVDDRFDGLVVAAFGGGHVPSWLVEPLGALAERMPVVLASRTGAGPLLARTYRGPGSETALLDRGLISAGFLDPAKARLLLHALLADGVDRSAITESFAAMAWRGSTSQSS